MATGIKLADGRVVNLRQYNCQVFRTGVPGEFGPDGKHDEDLWYVLAIMVYGSPVDGELVIQTPGGGVCYRANVKASLEATRLWQRVDPENALGRLAKAINAAAVNLSDHATPEQLRSWIKNLHEFSGIMDDHVKDVASALELARAFNIDRTPVEGWIEQQSAARAWGQFAEHLPGALRFASCVRPGNKQSIRLYSTTADGSLGERIEAPSDLEVELVVMERLVV